MCVCVWVYLNACLSMTITWFIFILQTATTITTTTTSWSKASFSVFQRSNNLIWKVWWSYSPFHTNPSHNLKIRMDSTVEMWMKPIVLGHHVTFLKKKKKILPPKSADTQNRIIILSLFLSLLLARSLLFIQASSLTHHATQSPIRKRLKVFVSLVYHLFLCWVDAVDFIVGAASGAFALFITN